MVSSRRCIFVLGMHRSGTSLLAGMLHLAGVDLGPSLLPPALDNPKGFFESINLININEGLLTALGHSFGMLASLPKDWMNLPLIAAYKDIIRMMLELDFPVSSLIAFKDPRLCLLYPIWDHALQEMGFESDILLILRPPLEVAQSLASRNSFSLTRSYLLWIEHVLSAERHTRFRKRIVLTYADILRDWRRVFKTIEEGFGFSFPRKDAAAERDMEEFIAEDLHHQRDFRIGRDASLRSAVKSMADSLMEALSRGSPGNVAMDRDYLKRVSQDFEQLRKTVLADAASRSNG